MLEDEVVQEVELIEVIFRPLAAEATHVKPAGVRVVHHSTTPSPRVRTSSTRFAPTDAHKSSAIWVVLAYPGGTMEE